jgi:hypothetical protein
MFEGHARMDDLLREFLTETSESLDTVDNQLVRFEQDPNNAKILDNIFRVVLAGGVHRLDGQLMVVLDVDRVLEIVPKTTLAA